MSRIKNLNIMEQVELINEKNRLLESIKSMFTKMAKRNIIFFFILCLAFAGVLVNEIVIRHNDIPLIDQVMLAIIMLASVVMVAICQTCCRKVLKTDNAQELLAVYDKSERTMKWMRIGVASIFAIVAIAFCFNASLSNYLLPLCILAFLSQITQNQNLSDDVEDLRELVEQKG